MNKSTLKLRSEKLLAHVLGEDDQNDPIPKDSIKDLEQQLYYGRYHLTVKKPITMWKITGQRPSNSYYGSARLNVPVAQSVELPVETQLMTANGELYLGLHKVVWSNPDDKHPFEKSYGPGSYYTIARRIEDGTFTLD